MPLIFADDLTGACDVGAQCLSLGWKVRVEFGTRGWGKAAAPARDEVVVADLESRRLSPQDAGLCAGEAGKAFMRRGLRPIAFKMDSTLRGNYLQEARALRKSVRATRVWFVPANPGQGRWTVEGRVFVNGIPLENTEYARDPLQPVSSGVVGGPGTANLGLDGKIPRKALYASVDAIDDSGLARFARLVRNNELVFGAAPIARHLVGRPGRKTRYSPSLTGRWLGIFGTLNPRTQIQLKAASKLPGVRVSWLKPGDLVAGKMPPVPVGVKAWLVALDPPAFRPTLAGKDALAKGNRKAELLGFMAEACRRAFSPSGLLVSGGLTAIEVCEKTRINGLTLLAELEPGLVASRAVWNGPRLEIITKPGGFGAGDAIVKIINRIRRT